MSEETKPATDEPLRPQVVEAAAEEEDASTFIAEPSKLLRIASMTRAMLEEVRHAPLDEAGRLRLLQIYEASIEQLHETLSEDLQEELESMFQPLQEKTASESELRIVQAQLVGWLEGLFHGIQSITVHSAGVRREPARGNAAQAGPRGSWR